jgi:type I restriction-modification system DNA methylase subunit
VNQAIDSERSVEFWLWDAANILRGPVDASDFKAYIFPLLFLKRISDVYDEERAGALAESGGDTEYADQPEQHRFLIPAGCHWSDLQSRSTNVGQAIQRAMRKLIPTRSMESSETCNGRTRNVSLTRFLSSSSTTSAA